MPQPRIKCHNAWSDLFCGQEGTTSPDLDRSGRLIEHSKRRIRSSKDLDEAALIDRR